MSFLGGLISWPMLAVIAAAIVIILILDRLLVKKPQVIQTVVSILTYANDLIELFMPEKYKEVYQAIVTALNSVTDGKLTQEEALVDARAVFKSTIKTLNITLTDAEANFADKIIVMVVDMIVKDPAAAKAAVNNVGLRMGYKFAR